MFKIEVTIFEFSESTEPVKIDDALKLNPRLQFKSYIFVNQIFAPFENGNNCITNPIIEMGVTNSFIKVLATSCKRFLKEEYLEKEGRNDDNSSSPGINLTSNKIGYCSLCHFERRPVGVYGDSREFVPS